MNLYRLDYVAPDGTTRAPVRNLIGEPYMTSSWAKARATALEAALELGTVVAIVRISGGGRMRIMARASGETGRVHRVTS